MNKSIVFLFVILVTLISCEPRVEMDMAQWGDQAFITNVEVLKLDIDDQAKLQEYYQSQTLLTVTGARILIISSGSAVVNNDAFTVKVKINPAELVNLSNAGIRIYHKGSLVEPVGSTPKAGVVADLSSKKLVYRVYSPDGSKHDWNIILE